MTRIESYNEAKEKAKRAREFAKSVLDKKYVDKFGAKITVGGTYKGYYGSSGVSSWGDDIVMAMQTQIELELRNIAQNMADRLEGVAARLRVEARNEALAILGETE